MVQDDPEAGLDRRLATVARRIVKLKRVMGRAAGCAQIDGAAEIEALVARYASLTERCSHLDQHTAGSTSAEKAKIAALVDDLAGAVEDAMIRIYLGFQTDPADDAVRPMTANRRG